MARLKPTHITFILVLVVFAILVLPQALRDRPGTRRVESNVVTQTMSEAKTNATVVYPVRLIEGQDAAHEAEHMFQALADLAGLGKVSLDTQTLKLTVAYDDAVGGDAPIRERLLGAGYLAPTRDDATPTKLSRDGSLQLITIKDDGKRFDPHLILAKQGIPIKVDFAPGKRCRVTVKFPEIGVTKDIARGGTVTLPALKPGDYQIACGEGGREGTLIVE